MKLNDERMDFCKIQNVLYKKRIDEIGIDKFIKELKDFIKKDSISSIKDSYDGFKKDLKCYPYSGAKLNELNKSIVKTLEGNKNNLPIFEIEDDDIEYNIKLPIIPFSKFYIATNIFEEIDKEIYRIGGFFVLDFDKDCLLVAFFWTRVIKDGWSLGFVMTKKDGLLKNFQENNFNFGNENNENYKKINLMAIKKFNNLMKKLIYKINKKEYTFYKKYSCGNYEEKEIVFDYDVRSHIRHFWEDTGYFNIPKMSKEEQVKNGYGINELVFKDGELRKDVPFKVIADFKVGGEKKEGNKVYDLIERKHLRQEEKIFKILREIFPNKLIRRHDRTTLNGLELDFNIPELRLGIEYDGEQHFDRKLCEDVFKSDFDSQVKRDRLKEKLCKKKNIRLIRIKFDEVLTKRHIRRKLQ